MRNTDQQQREDCEFFSSCAKDIVYCSTWNACHGRVAVQPESGEGCVMNFAPSVAILYHPNLTV